MAYTTSNIKLGALDSLTLDSVDVGGTWQPYTFSVENTTQSFRIEQSKFPIKTITTERTAQSETVLAEVTLANLAICYDMPTSNVVSDVLTLDSDERGSFSCVAVSTAGAAPGSNRKRTISMPQSRVSGQTSFNFSRENPVELSITLEHLADSNGSIGTITDANA